MNDKLDTFDRQTDANANEDQHCDACGGELVTIQDEYSDAVVCPACECEDEYDGQPSEYDEWQDYMGGDDWDHGQYDE